VEVWWGEFVLVIGERTNGIFRIKESLVNWGKEWCRVKNSDEERQRWGTYH
jgi:hypothetical protein